MNAVNEIKEICGWLSDDTIGLREFLSLECTKAAEV